jgi:hypothetical protein
MSLDFWRNVAVIWLCFQGFILLLVPLAIAFVTVRGMGWVLKRVPPLFHKAQGYSGLMRSKTEAFADKAAEPVIRARSKSKQAATVLERLFRPKPAITVDASRPLPVSTSGVTAVRTPPSTQSSTVPLRKDQR